MKPNNFDDLRYELKFNAKAFKYNEIIDSIRYGPHGYRQEHPSQTLNNLYFDTPNYAAFEDNVSGASNRAKLRLRWYDPLKDPRKIFLEAKLKRNYYGWKIRDKIELSFPVENLPISSLVKEIGQQASDELKIKLDYSCVPTLINRYHRDYFISYDGKLRITVDSVIKFSDPRGAKFINRALHLNTPDICVLEYKCAVNDYELLKETVSKISLVRTRNSKYIIGMSSVFGC